MPRHHYLLLIAFLFLFFKIGPNTAMADSGCIDCHSNETKLTQNLSQEKPKKSAMTSGAG